MIVMTFIKVNDIIKEIIYFYYKIFYNSIVSKS